ncbi:MAG TPA: DUF3153 domain-containing protein, partial [Chroococcidiopsis sp.]
MVPFFVRYPCSQAIAAIARWLLPLRVYGVMVVMAVACLGLTGCVHSETGISIIDQHHGEIVQRIRVSESLSTFSGTLAQDWLNSVKRRTRQLGGRIQSQSADEVVVSLPFHNGKELEQTFNQFFQPLLPGGSSGGTLGTDPDAPPAITPDGWPTLESHLSLKESNLLLVLRDRLTYDLDLRSLGVAADDGRLLLNPGSLFDLEFSLTLPWGAQSVGDSLTPAIAPDGKQLTWTLNPGAQNHIEVVFWVPS